MTNEQLMKKAIEAKEFSHSPYSNFRVGAALVTKGGKVYTGCNVECASYGGTNCAERTAIFKAVSEGHKDIAKIAITSDLDEYTFPCGICRQVIVEFGLDIEIILSNKDGKIKSFSIGELLPHSFTEDHLKK